MYHTWCCSLTVVCKMSLCFWSSHNNEWFTILRLEYITIAMFTIIACTKFTVINAITNYTGCMCPPISITIQGHFIIISI